MTPALRGTGRLPAAALLGLALVRPAIAAVGAAGGGVLLEPVAARPAALGEAWSSVGGTVEALGYNPAGLSGLPPFEGSALVRQGFAGDTFVSALAGGTFRGFGIAAGVGYLTTGAVERIDPTGRVSSVTAESDLVATAGVSRAIPAAPVSVGLAVKLVRSSLLEEAAANDSAVDLGVRGELASLGLGFGAAVQNWGGHLRYDKERYPVDNNDLPLLLRVGASWMVAFSLRESSLDRLDGAEEEKAAGAPGHTLRLLAEAVSRRTEHAVGWGGGLEYGYAGIAFVRGGYRILASGGAARDTAWSAGLGVALAGIRVDYAAEILSFTTIHRFGISVVRAGG